MAFFTSARSSVAGLIYEARAWTGVAINHTSSPITDVYIALHTADPNAGNQTTSEAAYTSYARVAVGRSTSGWTESGGVETNDAEIAFPACTGGSSTVTYASTGRDSSGAGQGFISGATSASLAVSSGITPRFIASALSITIA